MKEILEFRRSVRVFNKEKHLNTAKVRECIQLSTLAPSSSNMQLWEFYHVIDREVKEKLSKACLDQSATKTADQLVVIATRQDLHRQRARYILEFEKGNIERNTPKEKQASRIKNREMYFGRLMPFLYARFFGLIGFVRVLITRVVGLFRPIVREVSESNIRAVAHKSVGLAAQTFILAMANEGYDTCPLEGFDSKMVKKILKLPMRAQINMIVACGIRDGNKGIYGERCRVPFEDVYFQV